MPTTYTSVDLELGSLDLGPGRGEGCAVGLSRSPDIFALPLTFLAGSWGLSDLVLRKILLIITELAINTITSPVTSSLSIVHRPCASYDVSHILNNDKTAACTHIIL
jgi:hypothetical protein